MVIDPSARAGRNHFVVCGDDSLGYASLEGLIAATTLPRERLCRACFDGDYPLGVAAAEQGKYLLEDAVPGT